PKIDLDAGLLKPEHDQVQFAVAIDIGQLGRHIPVLTPHDRFREPPLPIAEEGLDAAEVADSDDIGEAVIVDIARGQGGIADVSPSTLSWGKGFAITQPDVE